MFVLPDNEHCSDVYILASTDYGLTADRSTVIHSLGRPDLLRNSEVILMKLKTSENFFWLTVVKLS